MTGPNLPIRIRGPQREERNLRNPTHVPVGLPERDRIAHVFATPPSPCRVGQKENRGKEKKRKEKKEETGPIPIQTKADP